MAAIDFPANPSNNQIFVAPSGQTFVFTTAYGGIWLPSQFSAASAIVSSTAPTTPVSGNLWWNTNIAQMFIYYNDGSSGQWVPVGPAALVPQLGSTWRNLGTITPTAGQSVVDFTALPTDLNTLMFDIGNVAPQTGDAQFMMRCFDGAGNIDAGNNYTTGGALSGSAIPNGNPALNVIAPGVNALIFSYNVANGGVSNASANGISVAGKLLNIRGSTTWRRMTFNSFWVNGAAAHNSLAGGGHWINTTSVAFGLRFLWSSGNYQAGGRITLWGSP